MGRGKDEEGNEKKTIVGGDRKGRGRKREEMEMKGKENK